MNQPVSATVPGDDGVAGVVGAEEAHGVRLRINEGRQRAKWMVGRIRPSHFGSHQVRSPSSPMTDGTSIIRTTVASSRAATARVTPSSVGGIGPVTPKATNTTIMMSAALVVGRPVRAMPSRMAGSTSPCHEPERWPPSSLYCPRCTVLAVRHVRWMCDGAPNGTSREPVYNAEWCSDQQVFVERVTRIELAFSAWEGDSG